MKGASRSAQTAEIGGPLTLRAVIQEKFWMLFVLPAWKDFTSEAKYSCSHHPQIEMLGMSLQSKDSLVAWSSKSHERYHNGRCCPEANNVCSLYDLQVIKVKQTLHQARHHHSACS